MIWLITVLFISLRLIPYVHNTIPLGYDPGIYLSMFSDFSKLPTWNYLSLSPWIHGNEPCIFYIQRILTGSSVMLAEASLIPMIVAASLLSFFGIRALSKKLYGKKTALWTTFLYSVSIIQYQTYWYYYLKNIAAIGFLAFALTFSLSSSCWALLFVVATGYTHRLTAAFLFLILGIQAIIQPKQRRFLLSLIAAGLILILPYYAITAKETVIPIASALFHSKIAQTSGTFLDPLTSLLYILFYVPFGIVGIWKLRKQRNGLLFILPLLLCFITIVFQLYFFKRLIPFFDLFFIPFAGYGAEQFFSTKRGKKLVIPYVLIALACIGWFINTSAKPLMYPDELAEIKLLRPLEPNAMILVVDNDYMPFVYGYSGHKVIAPMFGQYDIYWTENEWHQFWESNDREIEKKLLLKLPQPLYIFKGERTATVATDVTGPCFERINWRTFKFICTD